MKIAEETRYPGGSPHRILVIKLRHYGDVLLMTPVLSTLRKNHRSAMIDVLVYKGTEDMLQANENIYCIYTVDRSLKKMSYKKQYREESALWNSLRSSHYDLIINLSDQWRAAFYCAFLKPAFSIGFQYPKRRNLLWKKCHSLLVSTDGHEQQHMVLNNIDILTPLKLQDKIFSVTQSYRTNDVFTVNALIKKHSLKSFVLIQPTARWSFKTWSTEGFTKVINYLTARGETVVLSGGHSAEDSAQIKSICVGVTMPERVVNLAGRLELPELAVLIERAKLFVGVDSAPMHMAAALKTPSVVLFGPSNLQQWSPWQGDNILLWAGDYRQLPNPSDINTNTDERYLDAIPANDVIEAIHNMLLKKTAAISGDC